MDLRLSFLLLLLFFFACQKEEQLPGTPDADAYSLHIPVRFPQPAIPKDNLLARKRVELGRRLFYDPTLSLDSTWSCSSCHFAQLAFSDSSAVSQGIEGRPGTRNAQALANVVYQNRLLREASVPSLEMRVLVPITGNS